MNRELSIMFLTCVNNGTELVYLLAYPLSQQPALKRRLSELSIKPLAQLELTTAAETLAGIQLNPRDFDTIFNAAIAKGNDLFKSFPLTGIVEIARAPIAA